MIYTVTFNPAIDYVVRVDRMKTGDVNRASHEEIFFGGKGINVSWMLANLGVRSSALGFIAGFTGSAIEQGLAQRGIKTDFVRLADGFSRINVKIKSDDETELNGQGPRIGDVALQQLYYKLDALKSTDILVLAGSIPNTLPSDVYETIMKQLDGRGIKFAVDATQDLLVNVLPYRPFLIKPNNHELSEIAGSELKTEDDIVRASKDLQKKGARNVLVSMAKDGAILTDEKGGVHVIGTVKGKAVNSVGAGDSMVAGFIAGYEKTGSYDDALILGSAAGAATAFSEGIGEKADIDRLLPQLADCLRK